MTDQALDILKLVLLGLLYLFFARVLWAVWSEVRSANSRATAAPVSRRRAEHADGRRRAPPPARRKAAKGRGGRVARLVDRRAEGPARAPRSRSGRRSPSAATRPRRSPSTTTRSCPRTHLRIYDVDGQAMVEDLGSTNGSFHNGNRLVGARLLHPGDRIQVGYTVLEAQ